MATSGTGTIIQHLRRMVLRADGAGMTDGQLLREFVLHRDAAAFESLVRRHGPMVLGVCRRILHDTHDAEDAFQSTFLVLAHKAASVSPPEMIGNWLYGVAQTTAVRLRASKAKRRVRERQVADMPEPKAEPNDFQDNLLHVLDEELAWLPNKYRLPIVLCDLEGRSRREVAQQLKIPEGTLSSRLTTGRRMLAKRLSRHGLAVSGGMLAAAVSQNLTSACVSVSLVRSTVRAATISAAGQAATGLISTQAAALTEGVLKTMFLTKLKTIMGTVLAIVSLGGAAGLIYQSQAAEQPKAQQVSEKADQEKRPSAKKDQNPKPDTQQLAQDDQQTIRGVWRVIFVQQGNKEGGDKEAAMWEGSRWRIHAESIDIRCKDGAGLGLAYKLDPSRSPKILGLFVLGRLIPAIYTLEGDVLLIRMGLHETTFPKALTIKDSGNTILLILQREPVQKPKPERSELEKENEAESSNSDHSMGYIKIKNGVVQEYKSLFIKILGAVAGHFEQISYANQYDGRIEAYKTQPPTSSIAAQQRAVVNIVASDDYWFTITVRVNKVRIVGTKSEVIGRDKKLEQLILKEIDARQDQREKPPLDTPQAPPKRTIDR